MIRRSYEKMMHYAGHPKAIWWVNIIAFAESSIFPIPPDPLIIAIILNKRSSAWLVATTCTISSVIGGLVGYCLGYGFYETIGHSIVHAYGMEEQIAHLQTQFQQWGFWIVALKGLTPIPYKIVTITSGLAQLDLTTFMLASLIARGLRFYLLAFLLWYWGPQIKEWIERYMTWILTIGLLALLSGFIIIKYTL